MTIQVASLGVKSAFVNTNHIYSIPHHPYNGGLQFAGVNLANYSQLLAIPHEKYAKKNLLRHTGKKKKEI